MEHGRSQQMPTQANATINQSQLKFLQKAERWPYVTICGVLQRHLSSRLCLALRNWADCRNTDIAAVYQPAYTAAISVAAVY